MQLSSVSRTPVLFSLPLPAQDPILLRHKLTGIHTQLSHWVLDAPDVDTMATRSQAQNTIFQAVAKGQTTIRIDTHDLPPAMGHDITVQGPGACSAPGAVVMHCGVPLGRPCTIAEVTQRTDALIARKRNSSALEGGLEFIRSCKELIADIATMKEGLKVDAFFSLGVPLCELSEQLRYVAGQQGTSLSIARIFRDQLAPAVRALKPAHLDDARARAQLLQLIGSFIADEKENLDQRDRDLSERLVRAGMSTSFTLQ